LQESEGIDMSENKKVALVTGGNKGIGLETVRQLADKGFTVLLGARDAEKGEAAAAGLRKEGLDVRAVKVDVANPAHYKELAALIEKDYGKLDVLINNAGVMLENGGGSRAASAIPIETVRKTFDTNVFGTIELTQALLPLIRKSEAGRIVNLSSILGSMTLHSTKTSPIYKSKQLAYDMSKTALNVFTIELAHELARTPIKVNSAHPGWVKTEMGGTGAPMEIKEGAETSVWLATLPADGPTGGYFHKHDTLPW
jgi:NAD(P)-dependent dehydrogenase (short-subunit alcohol dehydrogenase family)